ncbi:MAG: AraC family transcriptional regulator, partial [Pseudomonadota bacterium]
MANGIEARLMRVIDHIDANLDGDLSLDALAEVAAFSRFHWHRSYVAVTGESCADTVRRRRLARAAEWLVGSERAMGEIARRAGYSGIPAFTRAFRAAYGQPPGAFRAAGRRPEIMLAPKERRPMTHDIIIREDPARRLCAVPYQGAYPAIGSAFERLTGRLAAREQWRDVGRMVAIYYDDPTTMPEAELRAHAACEFA